MNDQPINDPRVNDQRMNDQLIEDNETKLVHVLPQAVRPVNRELPRDLWPAMLRRLDEHPREQPWIAALFSSPAVPWFDWAMLAVLIVGVCVFPSSIPIWLYNF
jgi:hypothetical protein